MRLLALLLVLLSFVGDAGAQDRLRVMTYNIHHGATAGEEASLEEISTLIREVDADLVALQEVDRFWSERSGFQDQACRLAEDLGMHLVFGPIYDLPPDQEKRQRRQYGLAILSRYPIVASHNFELTRLTTITDEPERKVLPGFPMATIDVGGKKVHLFNTHLDYRADPSIREQQVGEMLDILRRFDGSSILAGDLNALPGAPELRPLFEKLSDSWTKGGEGEGLTYPAGAPAKRIDMILVSPEIAVDSVFVPISTASDHLPVVADLVVP